MTDEEKHILSTELEVLLEELPESIIDFLKEHSAGETGEDELEIDIDAISDDTFFALRKLLDDYLLEKRQKQAKPVSYEMEILNQSGLSNSSMQFCKGNDLVDEDVDIVGRNDPPVTDIPSVEIEKDAAHRNSKCSSSSSSSSELGSSSSDSFEVGHLVVKSDAAKASVPANATKGEKCDPEKLLIEREELERQRREGKARLQAEAKAAEEARRKAAAEAKRKRELEREAARQALQKMEDINENSWFMEDLEMLRTAQDEPLASFTEEASPEHLQKGLGSFKFQAP